MAAGQSRWKFSSAPEPYKKTDLTRTACFDFLFMCCSILWLPYVWLSVIWSLLCSFLLCPSTYSWLCVDIWLLQHWADGLFVYTIDKSLRPGHCRGSSGVLSVLVDKNWQGLMWFQSQSWIWLSQVNDHYRSSQNTSLSYPVFQTYSSLT